MNTHKPYITNTEEKGFLVTNAGVLSLLQDAGRYGAFNLGLTNGGPVDSSAFLWANRLCGNELTATTIEISLGGLALTAQFDCIIAVTGAPMSLTVNGNQKPLWCGLSIQAGDSIELGYSQHGVRCYLAVAGGFVIEPSFGSTATVCRESVGGLCGTKLNVNDVLPCKVGINSKNADSTSNNPVFMQHKLLLLPEHMQPKYSDEAILHTILSYQSHHFSSIQQRLFFSSEYEVSNSSDRMGYRLQGRKILSDIKGILSEGICYGAVQVPADGQPIVLLNDRQTIGGYPKIGAVISQDCAKLSQLRQGDKVHFEAISMSQANNLFHLNLNKFNNTQLVECT